jgi:Methyltransferase domain
VTSITSYSDIDGWFVWDDRTLFDALLAAQTEPGDLVELGAYLGRSAVIIGDHWRDGERFVVIDLFGAEVDDVMNQRENQGSYPTLTRTNFEANYLALHDRLPEVVQGLSTEVVEHVPPGSARFIHVDASHLYDQVAKDIVAIRGLLRPDGVVVFDDFRAMHTPGVAAAVWGAVVTQGLVPFALTERKLYATWGDSARHLEVVRGVVAAESQFVGVEEDIAGHRVLRMRVVAAPAPAPAPKPAAPVKAAPPKPVAPAKPATPPAARPLKRSDFVPPIVTRWVRARRKAARANRSR